jgi:hypothetical protein
MDQKNGSNKAADELPLDACGDYDIRIARNGTWYYRGSPINRPAMVRLFSTVLRREQDGEFWLVTPVERCRVAVEEAPFTAVEVNFKGKGRKQQVEFRTNVEDLVLLGPENPLRIASHENGLRPFVLVRPGLEALVLRAVYYHLADRAEEGPGPNGPKAGIWSQGHFFPLAGA